MTSCSASFARPRYVSRLVLHMLFDVMTATTTQTYNHASICHGFNQQRVAHKSSPNKLFLKRSAPYLHLQSEGWRCLGGLSAPSPSRRRNAKPKDTANNYENSAKPTGALQHQNTQHYVAPTSGDIPVGFAADFLY